MVSGAMLDGCQQTPMVAGSALLALLGPLALYQVTPQAYGKHSKSPASATALLPARTAWFLQELPAFVVPAGMLARESRTLSGPPAGLLLGLFCAHYFHR